MRGRPLWFLGMCLIGWTGIRAMLLWPEGQAIVADLPTAIAPIQQAMASPMEVAPSDGESVGRVWTAAHRKRRASADRMPTLNFASGRPTRRDPAVRPSRRLSTRESDVNPSSGPVRPADPLPFVGTQTRADLPDGARSRWSGSAWLIVRDGGSNPLVNPLLGGSQAGVRLVYRLDGKGRLAGFGRVAGPLGSGRADLAGGIQFRPRPNGPTIYAEVRRYDRRVAPAVGAFGGGTLRLPEDFRLDGYGLVGAIAGKRVAMVSDAHLRLIRTIGGIEVGAGGWGALQPRAARFDLGPTIAIPIRAGRASLRLALDWRHRIMGNARPRSGPVLSLGSDF